MSQGHPRVASLKSIDAFRRHLASIGADLPTDDRILSAAEGSPLAQPIRVGGFTVGNRWAVQPMEGWDATPDGRPTEPLLRRWRHFGESGAKLIWGGEAFAVRRHGRANPNQLYFHPDHKADLRTLLTTLVTAHTDRFGAGAADDLLIGLQLTHSGRFSRPNRHDRPEPRIAYHHPLLDQRLGIDPSDESVLLSDGEIDSLIEAFVACAKAADEVGFHFVDLKHCHGYLGHEFLSAYTRPGSYGGGFEGRTRFLRRTVEAIRAACPGLMIGVRLSAFDSPPFPRGEAIGPGYPAFGCDTADPYRIDLTEPIHLLTMLRDELRVELTNITAGSPYYNPHLQRPAYFPPSDGYEPPEDPLIGCARQVSVVRRLKQAVPGLPMVGSAYSYLQEFLPHVAQAVVREGWADFVGLGRSMLAYWDLAADVIEGRSPDRKRFCRTFSDCTTGPRHGLPSGCYPLDGFYKTSPHAAALRQVKASASRNNRP